VRLRFLSIAAIELRESIAYYESIAPGLGERFLSEIEGTLDRIAAHPTAWARFGGELRRCRMTNFPYGLIYAVQDESILIVAVANMHRNPEHWRRRFR